jgi:phosphoglycerol transferase MdoB-like AlkP superfamily enzyme
MTTRTNKTQRALPPEFIIWLRVGLITVDMLVLARALLFAVYHETFADAAVADVVKAFVVGLRFDVATALLTMTVPMLVLWVPWPPRAEHVMRMVSRWMVTLLLFVAAGFLWSDILFFGESGRHITVEPAGILNDMLPMVTLVFMEYILQFLGLLAFLAALFFAVRWAYAVALRSELPPRPAWSWPVSWIMLIAVTLIGIRGGLQKEPLKSSDAVVTGNYAAGNLALNGWYSYLYTMFNKQHAARVYMGEDEATRIVRALVQAPWDKFESARFPLLRESIFPAEPDSEPRMNVVLIVVESLNASYLPSFGGERNVMPFLDSLARQSLIFTNCSSFGTRSFRGLCAITASIPNLGENPYAITLTLPKLRGLGTILKECGYHVRFMHAAAPGSMGVMAIAHMAGYDQFESAADFKREDANESWGVWDHIALERMTREMDNLREPFHYGIFTLCTHAPWDLPTDFEPPFGSEVPEAARLNTFAYLDNALQKFFAHEQKQKRFGNTLYVIVGDHTSHAAETERFRVGCIFYAPGHLQPEVRNYPVSHLDILPTILDVCHLQPVHAAFGKSMFADTTARFVVTDQSNVYGWQKGNRLLVCDAERALGLYDVTDMERKQNLLTAERSTAEQLRKEFCAFFQTAETALRENRVSKQKDEG